MRTTLAALLLLVCAPAIGAAAPDTPPPLAQGASFTLDGRRAVVTKLDALPLVESEITKRFKFDAADNPKLRELRERFKLDEVVAAGKDEFDRQVLLLDWANRQLKKFGRPTSKARGALDILAANEEGHAFFCAHYGDVFCSAAASMGWVDRVLALRRPDNVGSGSTEHTSTEIWSNQHRKWVMFDPTFAMYAEKDGRPLSAFELRREWFYAGGGRDLTFVMGKERKRFKRSDMPVFRGRYAGFGDLNFDAGAINPYAFIGYVPNTDLMTAGLDYGKMFITRDALCDGTRWHTRVAPADPAVDPYFPINQAAITLTPDGGAALRVGLRTMTPNFKTYEARTDGSEWRAVGESFTWTPRPGVNTLEVRAVNVFGVTGPISTVELRM